LNTLLCSNPQTRISALHSTASTFTTFISASARFERQRKIFPREIADLERIRRSLKLRRFLETSCRAYGLKEPTVPNLNVAGWWDQEDFTADRHVRAPGKIRFEHLNYLVADRGIMAAGAAARASRLAKFLSGATHPFIFARTSRPMVCLLA